MKSYTWEELGLKIPRLLLPKQGTDMEKWAVVACDQFTSDPAYWEKAQALVGDAPSTLRLMLPEFYLGSPDEEARIAAVRSAMRQYLEGGTLQEKPEGCVLVERTAEGRTRRGLVLCVDLEAYDYSEGSTSLIRATEKTIVSRIPPRLRIRKGAQLELPHIIILIDDPERTVIEPLAELPGECVYDTDLMLGGGHIRGTFLAAGQLEAARDAFSALLERAKTQYGADRPLLMAMGDGNHSLATAKANWTQLREELSEEERRNHPARYALCEIENLHDDGIVFEPIHRVLFSGGKATGEEMVRELVGVLQEQNGAAYLQSEQEGSLPSGDSACAMQADMENPQGGPCYRIPVLTGKGTDTLVIQQPSAALEVGALQSALDVLVQRKGYEIDYIHGAEEVRRLCADPSNAGFLLPSMDKFRLLPAVAADGTLPRKTFSMGEAVEKRYYMEARKLV